MLTRLIRTFGLSALVGLLAAATGSMVMAKDSARNDEGKVEAIEIVYSRPDKKPISPGTVIGGVAGGVIGHQFGSGRGKTAATVAGTVGGAVVGNQIEKKQKQEGTPRYRVTVRLDSGSSVIVEDTRDPNLRVGDRVRIEGGQLHRI